jgi:ribosomal protein S18 acetylase RimI-like enzyme
VVRDARADDAEAIARVHVAAWQEAYKQVFPPEALALLSVEQRTGQWDTWLKHSEVTVLVAEQGEEVRAFASGGPSRDEERSAELYAIYVDPPVWGSGMGSALLLEIEGRLRDAGLGQAMLWVLRDNPRARSFYEAAGWCAEASRSEIILGVELVEIRYRKRLLSREGRL